MCNPICAPPPPSPPFPLLLPALCTPSSLPQPPLTSPPPFPGPLPPSFCFPLFPPTGNNFDMPSELVWFMCALKVGAGACSAAPLRSTCALHCIVLCGVVLCCVVLCCVVLCCVVLCSVVLCCNYHHPAKARFECSKLLASASACLSGKGQLDACWPEHCLLFLTNPLTDLSQVQYIRKHYCVKHPAVLRNRRALQTISHAEDPDIVSSCESW